MEDNAGLYEALSGEFPVQAIFIFDSNILTELPENDGRVEFIHKELQSISAALEEKGASLDIRHGNPSDIWENLMNDYDIQEVYTNRDYEPYARERDKIVYESLKEKGIPFKAKKDHVIFEKAEVVKKDGTPYAVFTPYSKIWKSLVQPNTFEAFNSNGINNWNQRNGHAYLSLQSLGFSPSGLSFPDKKDKSGIIKEYHEKRDIPSVRGTSRLGIHLRFGTISVRQLAKSAYKLNEKFLNELIWRDFYSTILWHFPKIVTENFSAKYNQMEWRNDPEEFEKWCQGKTGYPIVDAGMRELNATGFMHNRVRMIVASFLTKHLLIDWRWGEAYFAEKLLDFDLASNNGGWQWAAGTGVDAAPYFRIFNPYTQTQKFDKNLEYIKKWVPEFQELTYYKEIVDHKMARQRALDTYKQALAQV